jgi:hypothetical protein
MTEPLQQVGAPDPELRTSPIFDEDEERSLDLGEEASVCYFNSLAYPLGAFVRSGHELLRCEEGGVWVRRGEAWIERGELRAE